MSPLAPALVNLVDTYARSDIGIKADGEQLRREVVRADTAIALAGMFRSCGYDLFLTRIIVICGLFFHNVTLMGVLCFYAFSDSYHSVNGYYSSFTYFSSTVHFLRVCLLQILFDILPLRLVPLLMFGGIVYGLVGLVPTVAGFWKFMLTLVLFNLTNASMVLWLSIGFASVSVASLVGTLIMLFKFVDPFILMGL